VCSLKRSARQAALTSLFVVFAVAVCNQQAKSGDAASPTLVGTTWLDPIPSDYLPHKLKKMEWLFRADGTVLRKYNYNGESRTDNRDPKPRWKVEGNRITVVLDPKGSTFLTEYHGVIEHAEIKGYWKDKSGGTHPWSMYKGP
jgi:hypothetical protein